MRARAKCDGSMRDGPMCDGSMCDGSMCDGPSATAPCATVPCVTDQARRTRRDGPRAMGARRRTGPQRQQGIPHRRQGPGPAATGILLRPLSHLQAPLPNCRPPGGRIARCGAPHVPEPAPVSPGLSGPVRGAARRRRARIALDARRALDYLRGRERGYGEKVSRKLPKLQLRVRFPLPAPPFHSRRPAKIARPGSRPNNRPVPSPFRAKAVRFRPGDPAMIRP